MYKRSLLANIAPFLVRQASPIVSKLALKCNLPVHSHEQASKSPEIKRKDKRHSPLHESAAFILLRPKKSRKGTPQQNLHHEQTITDHATPSQVPVPFRRPYPHLAPQHKRRADATQRRPRKRQEQKCVMQTRMPMIVVKRNADPARASRHIKHTCQYGNPFLVPPLLVVAGAR